jgi:hypothetical protein
LVGASDGGLTTVFAGGAGGVFAGLTGAEIVLRVGVESESSPPRVK